MAPRSKAGAIPRPITLSSDLGWAYAAQMKAEIYRRMPSATVIDLAHDLPPFRVSEAGFVVRAMARRFPPGTVHVVVVDPGVGGTRAPVAVSCADGSILVGPDNGVLSPLAEELGKPAAFRLDPARVAPGPRVGTTFDGRDLFAPAAARLAAGEPPERLGRPHPLLRNDLPPPRRRRDGADGRIVHVDRFGNLITDVPGTWGPSAVRTVEVRLRGRPGFVAPWGRSYEEFGARHLGVLVSSFGTVEISIGEGSAAARLRVGSGTPLGLTWRTGSEPRATETVNIGRSVRGARR